MSEWFERMKLSLHNRVKQNTIEVNPNGQRVLMKYGGFFFKKWHIIEPPVIEEEGRIKMVWQNFLFGGWPNLFKLIGTLAIFGFVFWSVSNLFDQFNAIISTDCVKACLTITNSNPLDVINLP